MTEIATNPTFTTSFDPADIDEDYVFSPFTGVGMFLTEKADIDTVRVTFGVKTLHEMLDETCLGRSA